MFFGKLYTEFPSAGKMLYHIASAILSGIVIDESLNSLISNFGIYSLDIDISACH